MLEWNIKVEGKQDSMSPSMLEWNIEVEGKQDSCFPWSQLLSVLLRYTSQLKNRKKLRRNRLLDAGWLTNLPRFQGARPDHVRVESSSCCFHRELVSFDPWHMTHSPILKRI